MLGDGDMHAVDGPSVSGGRRFQIVDGYPEDVENPSQQLLPHGNHERPAGVRNRGSPCQPLGRHQRDPSDHFIVELDHDLDAHPAVFTGQKHVSDVRQLARLEAGVDYAAADGYDGSLILLILHVHLPSRFRLTGSCKGLPLFSVLPCEERIRGV